MGYLIPRSHLLQKAQAQGPKAGADQKPTAVSLLTVDEASDCLRVSRWAVNRLIQNHQLPAIKLGGRRLIPLTSIHGLIDQLIAEETEVYEV